MTVGQLSRRTGISVKNLRAYTDLGLIYTAGRSSANYRQYTREALWCVRWIGVLRGLGLTVAEIRDLARAHHRHPDHAGHPDGCFTRRLARELGRSRQRLQTRIAELEQTLQRIDEFETRYRDELARGDDTCWDNDPPRPLGLPDQHLR